MYCDYYLAKADTKRMWFVVGCFRNEDGVAFVRAPEGYRDYVEFFVAPAYVERFLKVISFLIKDGYLLTFAQKPNRVQHDIPLDQLIP